MKAIDLFAGAGGFSTGATMAGVQVIWAANHWPAAVQVHSNNHPGTAHACQDLQQADWTQVPAHDLLLASPACQGHSPARGKDRPHHDTQRATAWSVVSALECHKPQGAVIENVKDFAKWTLFPAWCAAMNALGYALSFNLVDSADHGVPQQRVRLFIVATRSKHPIELALPKREHTGIGSVIEWDAGKWSPIEKTGRSAATLERIRNGRARHGPGSSRPTTATAQGSPAAASAAPLGPSPTIDRWGVINGDRMRMLSATEAKRAMGFPSTYLLPERHKDAMHMLGNAVVPVVAADVINALRAAA